MNRNPFTVPDGYFDTLTDQIMSQLPERVREETKIVPLWDRMKSWAYMAAMFVGISLMVNLFTRVTHSSELRLSSSADIEEFYRYYEDQLASNTYHEELYIDVD